eukprot:1838910-Prymnesium_polylepis.1
MAGTPSSRARITTKPSSNLWRAAGNRCGWTCSSYPPRNTNRNSGGHRHKRRRENTTRAPDCCANPKLGKTAIGAPTLHLRGVFACAPGLVGFRNAIRERTTDETT